VRNTVTPLLPLRTNDQRQKQIQNRNRNQKLTLLALTRPAMLERGYFGRGFPISLKSRARGRMLAGPLSASACKPPVTTRWWSSG
jgi:hypothetical protein